MEGRERKCGSGKCKSGWSLCLQDAVHGRKSDFGTSGVTWMCAATRANEVTPAVPSIRPFGDCYLDPLPSTSRLYGGTITGLGWLIQDSSMLTLVCLQDKRTKWETRSLSMRYAEVQINFEGSSRAMLVIRSARRALCGAVERHRIGKPQDFSRWG